MDIRETVIGPLARGLVLLGSGVGALVACIPTLAKVWVEVAAARAAAALRRRLEPPAHPRRATHLDLRPPASAAPPRRARCHGRGRS